MHTLTFIQCQSVSGGKIKHDAAAFTLSISGATMVANGVVMGITAATCSSSTLAKAAVVQIGLGAVVLASVAACEYVGVTFLHEWYETYQDYKYWKSNVFG